MIELSIIQLRRLGPKVGRPVLPMLGVKSAEPRRNV